MKILNILYIEDDDTVFDTFVKNCKEYFGTSEAERNILKGISYFRTGDHTIVIVKNSKQAISEINIRKFDLAFIDFKLTDETGDNVGKQVFEEHKRKYSDSIYLIMLTAIDVLLETLRANVFRDFLKKPIHFSDFAASMTRFDTFQDSERRRIEAEKRAERAEKSEREMYSTLRELQKGFNVDIDSFTDKDSLLKGNSEPMKQIRWFIDLYAKVDLPVLLIGETGTGKELVTREIHNRSRRRNGPFEPINCAAIPETLIESELFGAMAEAYTDAKKSREGAFKRADNGTLFLDEFGDMNSATQVKVLRAIETGEILPLGAKKVIRVNVRVICATSKQLKEKAGSNEFRIDLFYRVGGFFPELPALRDRKNDIINICAYYFLQKGMNYCFTQDAIDELVNNKYNWPGNVRELLRFFDHSSTLFPNTSFDKSKTLKLLELWKTHQPVKGLANTFKEPSNNIISSTVQPPNSDLAIDIIQPYEVKDLISFLKNFLEEYEKFEKTFEQAPTLTEIEKILEPSNKRGWLSQRFSKTEADNKKVIYAINYNKELNRLKTIAPFKKFFN